MELFNSNITTCTPVSVPIITLIIPPYILTEERLFIQNWCPDTTRVMTYNSAAIQQL